MKFYYLSHLQKIDITITTVMFCIFIGILRPLFLGLQFNSRDVIIYTILFFVWYGCTLLMSNAFLYKYQYDKMIDL